MCCENEIRLFLLVKKWKFNVKYELEYSFSTEWKSYMFQDFIPTILCNKHLIRDKFEIVEIKQSGSDKFTSF